MRRLIQRATLLAATLAGCTLLQACQEIGREDVPFDGTTAEEGAALIKEVGCGGCHQIPGIGAADGLVGPPLDHMARRIYIAGLLRNTPDNMVTWLMHPQKIVPGNAMPDMDLNTRQARAITNYLYTLE